MEKEVKEVDVWKNLRPYLSKTYNFNEFWDKAIKLFENRFETKYFKPLRDIISKDELKGEGFTILTVECALIETFATFRTGQIYCYDTKNRPAFYYSASKKIYTDFLKSAFVFKNIFWADSGTSSTLFDDKEFYDNVRCGLMHEGRTKNGWLVNAKKEELTSGRTDFLVRDGQNTKVHRTLLFLLLAEYLKQYCDDLRQAGDNGSMLRKYFARKTDHIFDLSHQSAGYDWWNP